jgi:hypothetical protein
MYSDAGGPALSGCTFEENTGSRGGGMYNDGSGTSVTRCVFVRNRVGLGGAGMYNAGGSDAVLVDCAFDQNNAKYLGMLYNADSNPTIINCTFAANTTDHSLAGMYNWNSHPAITNCRFVGNHGHALVNANGSSPTVRNCLFVANSSAIGAEPGTTTVVNSIIRGPFLGSPPAIIMYSNVPGAVPGPGNFDADPGFVAERSGTLADGTTYDAQSRTTTFTAEGAAFAPGGLAGGFFQAGPVSRRLPIVANTATTITVRGPWTAIGGGGASYVVRDYHLASGSSCIDAGNNWAVPADATDLDGDGDTLELTPLDLDGNPRFSADEAPSDPGCGMPVIVDLGPSEYQLAPASQILLGDLDGDGRVDIKDLLAILSAWGPCLPECCLADLDLDGITGEIDLLIVLEGWRF